MTVPSGSAGVDVPVTASTDWGGRITAHVTVSYANQSLSGPITIDPGLRNIQLPASDYPNAVDVFVTLTGPAPAGGLTVRLSSDNPAVTVPPSIILDAGSTGAEASDVTVSPVTENTTVHISATLGTRTLSASRVLLPPFDGSSSMQIIPEADGDIYGLDDYRPYTILLSNPAPDGGLTVSLKVTDGDSSIRLDQDTAYITAGSILGQFRIQAADVTRTTHAEIQATAEGVVASIPVTIQPRLTSITDVPVSVQSGKSFQATVNLAGPADKDIAVALQSNWGILDVPGQVIVPAGATSATFTATTVPVDSPSDVTIIASLGQAQAYSTVTLTP